MPIKNFGRLNQGSFFTNPLIDGNPISATNLAPLLISTLLNDNSNINEYVQSKLLFDEIPTSNSSNVLTSDVIFNSLALKVNTDDLTTVVPASLSYDNIPISGSINFLRSGDVFNALSLKANVTELYAYATQSNVDTSIDSLQTSILTLSNEKAPLNNPTFTGTVSGITKEMIGLGNVANLSPDDYPISTETQEYVDTTISNLIDSAPEALNTLKELSTALNDDANFASTMTTTLALKANITYVDNIIGNLNLQAGNNSIDTNSPVFFNKISIVDSSNTYVEITPSRLFFSSGFSYSGGSGSSSTSSFQPTQSYFGFSNTNNNNNYSFLTGYTWNTLKFNSVGANNISGLTYDNNGEFSIPAGTYQINWFAHYAEENDTRYLGFQHGTSVSPETDTGVMQVYSTFLTQSHTFSTIFIFTQTTGFRMWTGGNNKSNSIVARNNNLIITKLA